MAEGDKLLGVGQGPRGSVAAYNGANSVSPADRRLRLSSLPFQAKALVSMIVGRLLLVTDVIKGLTGSPDRGPPVVGVQPRKWEDDHSHEAPPAHSGAGCPQGP